MFAVQNGPRVSGGNGGLNTGAFLCYSPVNLLDDMREPALREVLLLLWLLKRWLSQRENAFSTLYYRPLRVVAMETCRTGLDSNEGISNQCCCCPCTSMPVSACKGCYHPSGGGVGLKRSHGCREELTLT